jgi:hypothetical protein
MPTVTEIEHLHQLQIPELHPNSEIYSACTDLDHRKDQTDPEPGQGALLCRERERRQEESVIPRFGDPYTGVGDAMTAETPMSSLMERAFFASMTVDDTTPPSGSASTCYGSHS